MASRSWGTHGGLFPGRKGETGLARIIGHLMMREFFSCEMEDMDLAQIAQPGM